MRRCTGFTITELLIVIGIIVILSTVTIISFGTSKKSISLDLETDKFVSSINKLQTWARTGFGNGINEPSTCYRVHFITDKSPKWEYGKIENGQCKLEGTLKEITIDPNLITTKILLDNNEHKETRITITPPYGTLNFEPDGNSILLNTSFPQSVSQDGSTNTTREVQITRESGQTHKR